MSHTPQALGASKARQAGSVTVTVTDLTKAITFATPMPSTNYEVFFQVKTNIAVVLWPSAFTAAGFTLNLSVGITGTISYMVIED